MNREQIIYELKDWSLWIAGSMIAALVISNLAGMLMGTGTPFIAVTTGSMIHDATTSRTYVQWMLDHNFTVTQLDSFPLSSGFNPGDAIIVLGANPGDIVIGDVIIYHQAAYNMPIIHRVYAIQDRNNTRYFFTKGDHNEVPDPWVVSEEEVEGRATIKIPFLGSINTLFVRIFGGVKG